MKITQNALQSLVAVVLNADGELNGKGIVEGLEVSVNFGEYANPSFESQVETVSKARQGGLMSVETRLTSFTATASRRIGKPKRCRELRKNRHCRRRRKIGA